MSNPVYHTIVYDSVIGREAREACQAGQSEQEERPSPPNHSFRAIRCATSTHTHTHSCKPSTDKKYSQCIWLYYPSILPLLPSFATSIPLYAPLPTLFTTYFTLLFLRLFVVVQSMVYGLLCMLWVSRCVRTYIPAYIHTFAASYVQVLPYLLVTYLPPHTLGKKIYTLCYYL